MVVGEEESVGGYDNAGAEIAEVDDGILEAASVVVVELLRGELQA